MNDRPEEFANTGLINIEKNIDKFMVAAQVLNKPVGVVYESKYHLMVVDICIGKMDIILMNVLFQKFRGLRLLFLRNGVEDSSF